jgi:hypothetical protein
MTYGRRMNAVALVDHVGDARHLDNGRQMSAYPGFTLGSILPAVNSACPASANSKRGNVYLCERLLLLGVRAAIPGMNGASGMLTTARSF